jgi:GNAT superfamily N-acetyltransferase
VNGNIPAASSVNFCAAFRNAPNMSARAKDRVGTHRIADRAMVSIDFGFSDMTGTVTVRRATEADIPTLAYHRAAMFRDMGVLRGDLFEPLLEATMNYLPGAMQTGEYISWVAIDAAGQIVAGAGLQLRRMLPRPNDDGGDIIHGPQAIVLNVYTEQTWRRRGIARLLMQELLQWTADNGVKSVVLHAAPEARTLYETLGFVAANEMRLAARSGAWHDR